jgi:hypothetical protein
VTAAKRVRSRLQRFCRDNQTRLGRSAEKELLDSGLPELRLQTTALVKPFQPVAKAQVAVAEDGGGEGREFIHWAGEFQNKVGKELSVLIGGRTSDSLEASAIISDLGRFSCRSSLAALRGIISLLENTVCAQRYSRLNRIVAAGLKPIADSRPIR